MSISDVMKDPVRSISIKLACGSRWMFWDDWNTSADDAAWVVMEKLPYQRSVRLVIRTTNEDDAVAALVADATEEEFMPPTITHRGKS